LFLQVLMHSGSLNGAKILRPETVSVMMTNQIGDLNVEKMVTAQPALSNSFDQFPGVPHKWGFSFDITETPGPHGRSAGSVSWAGLLNTYFWVDPVKKVSGAIFTQVLPLLRRSGCRSLWRFRTGPLPRARSRLIRRHLTSPRLSRPQRERGGP
jgi:methyl acetate hydrolase